MPLADPADLARALGSPSDHLVVLDFDGTLAPIVDRPQDAVLAPGAAAAIRRLARYTRVVVSSGRDLDDLRGRLPGIDVVLAAGHGSTITEAGETLVELVDVATVRQTLDRAESAVRRLVDDRPGWLTERKPTSLAVHHRLVPVDDEHRMLGPVRAALERHLDVEPGFDLLAGKSVLELRVRGVDKGRALNWMLRAWPGRLPLVLGDDVTDEDAFAVARDHGGTAVLVADVPRDTSATDRLADPGAVVSFLEHFARWPGKD